MEQVKQKYGIWRWRDPMSALTHMIGFFLAIPFGILLIVQQALQENTAGVVGVRCLCYRCCCYTGPAPITTWPKGHRNRLPFGVKWII